MFYPRCWASHSKGASTSWNTREAWRCVWASWKYLEPRQGPKRSATTNIELGNDSEPQLYDLSKDPGETQNLASQYPERVKKHGSAVTEDQAGWPQPAVRQDRMLS